MPNRFKLCLPAVALASELRLSAQNPVKGTYGYLYCHMSDRGEYTAYALSRDGYHYEDLIGGNAVIDPKEHARIEGGQRDAYVCRSWNGEGFVMVATDMCVAKSHKWDNYGIDLLRSDDLIHWQSVTFDFRQAPGIFTKGFSPLQGGSAGGEPSVYKDWSTIDRVWAPQIFWDPSYVWPDGDKGGYFIYYSMWNSAEEAYDRMYYSYADKSFTKLTQPRLLFDWGYATIDADINLLDDGLYHMLIKKEGGHPGIYTATSEHLTYGWGEPVEDDYVSFEGKKKCEGSSAFQLIGDKTWRVAYIQYSDRPKHYRICKADEHLRNFHDPVDIEGVTGPQHGSFLRLTKEEYERLQQWSAQQASRQFTVNITPDGQAKMEAYLPQQPTGRAVVVLPGGGYSHLAMQHEGHDWAPWFNERGIACFVLTYRMPQGDRNIPLSDARQAIRTVRDSAQVWGINPMDVGIMGSSAGGHLASSVSTHSEYDCRPNFSILFYPVISMDQRVTHKGSCVNFLGEEGAKDEQLVKEWSNQNAVVSHLTPPAIIITANDDGVVPPVTNGVAYYSEMRKKGNHCSLYVYPSGGHGFGFRSSWPFHDQMLTDLNGWLQTLPVQKNDAVRVACIGNSITHGSGIDMQEQKGYPAQLQKLLGNGYVVKNYGVGARCMMSTSDHPYMQEQAWRDTKAFRPDVVVIKLGTNDSKDYQWNQQQYEKDYQAMIDTLLSLPSKPKVYLCTPIRAFQPRWGITDSVIVNGVIPSIQKMAKKNSLPVIDLHSVITDVKEMTSDMIHPNDKGAARMARAVADAIKPE